MELSKENERLEDESMRREEEGKRMEEEGRRRTEEIDDLELEIKGLKEIKVRILCYFFSFFRFGIISYVKLGVKKRKEEGGEGKEEIK